MKKREREIIVAEHSAKYGKGFEVKEAANVARHRY